MGEATFIVRPATPADLTQVAVLAGQMVRMHNAFDPQRFAILHEPIEPGYENWLGQELKNRRAMVLVAVPKRSRAAVPPVLGYAYGRLEPRDWNRLLDACGVLHDLVVAERARRQGVATALLDATAQWMTEHDAPRLVLETAWKNQLAQELFQKRGFRQTMIEMVRELPPPQMPATGARADA